MDFRKTEEKWQKRWSEEKVFESNPDNRKKFYITVAYPYPSGGMHVGHVRTYTVPDIVSRFKRMQGFNVLFPMAWHVTGTPIIGAVNRLKEKEKKQLHVLRDVFKVSDKDLKSLDTPMGFARYFIENHYKAGMQGLGYTIDWRRQFTTNDPHYNRFIEWQHTILYKKGLEKKGLHPVKWCLNCKNPVTTHDLLEGESADIQEFTLVKFSYRKNQFIIAATLRPDALYGQTNMWINPDITYAIVKVGKEEWIIGKEAVEKLNQQGIKAEQVGEIKGIDMIGHYCKGPLVDYRIMILPTFFIDSNIASGIVYSALETPVDWLTVKEMQDDSKFCKKYNLDIEKVKKIKPIAIIKIPGMGNDLGGEILKEFGVTSTKQAEALDKAKKEIYKRVSHQGIMRENCGKYAGMRQDKAKQLINSDLIKKKQGALMLEFSEPVRCRCGHPVVVAKKESWFIDYGNRNWKAKAKKCVKSMSNIPAPTKEEFFKTIDWLHDWPCVRNFGLGTHLPHDKRFMIEPLSDSTIYMSFYLLAHRTKDYKPEQWTKSFFDYVMLEKGSVDKVSKETGIPAKELREIKKEVQYWYPLDWRCSALELIPNHLTFMVFHHTAIFPEKNWPRGIATWGMGLLEGGKMSSSKGNVVLASEAIREYGADATRLFLFSSVEPWQDFDWRKKEVRQYMERLLKFHDRVLELSGKGKDREDNHIDMWLLSETSRIIRKTTESLEVFQTRKASLECFFRMSENLRWYERRSPEMNRRVLGEVIEAWIKMMSPFIPHTTEELWERLGKKGLCSTSQWPKPGNTDERLDMMEEMVRQTNEDIVEIIKLVKKKPREIRIYASPHWKHALYEKALQLADKPQEIIPALMQSDVGKKMGKDALRFAQAIQKSIGGMKSLLTPEEEVKVLKDAEQFLKVEYGCDVKVFGPGESDNEKARRADPGKPGIEVIC